MQLKIWIWKELRVSASHCFIQAENYLLYGNNFNTWWRRFTNPFHSPVPQALPNLCTSTAYILHNIIWHTSRVSLSKSKMLTLTVFKKLENITLGRNQDSYVSLAEIVQKITIFPISVNWFLLLLNTLS